MDSYANTRYLVVGMSVMVVETLRRRGGEPCSVGAVVIDHVIGPHPPKLVALVEAQPRQGRLVPPEPPMGGASAPSHIIGICYCIGAFTPIYLKSIV